MKPSPSAADLLQVWRFIRGDMDSGTFELWLVENEQMKAPLGRAWYVDLISADYRHQRAVWWQALWHAKLAWQQARKSI